MDAAAALLSSITTLCLFAAARRLALPTVLVIMLTAAALPVQYFLLKHLHAGRTAAGRKVAEELEEVLHSLAHWLSLGVALEVAVQEVAQRHRGTLKPALTKVAEKVAAGNSVDEAVEAVFNKLELIEVKRLLLLISKFSRYSSDRAGLVVRQVARLMERNRVLKERLVSSIKREELKVKMLSVVYPMVLAALYQLARVVASMGYMETGEVVALNFSLVALSTATPLYATLIVMGKGALKRGLSSLLIYLILQMVLMALLP